MAFFSPIEGAATGPGNEVEGTLLLTTLAGVLADEGRLPIPVAAGVNGPEPGAGDVGGCGWNGGFVGDGIFVGLGVPGIFGVAGSLGRDVDGAVLALATVPGAIASF